MSMKIDNNQMRKYLGRAFDPIPKVEELYLIIFHCILKIIFHAFCKVCKLHLTINCNGLKLNF